MRAVLPRGGASEPLAVLRAPKRAAVVRLTAATRSVRRLTIIVVVADDDPGFVITTFPDD